MGRASFQSGFDSTLPQCMPFHRKYPAQLGARKYPFCSLEEKSVANSFESRKSGGANFSLEPLMNSSGDSRAVLLKNDETVQLDWSPGQFRSTTGRCSTGRSVLDRLQARNLPLLDPWFAETHAGRIDRLLAAELDRH
jgi:hypothetical protein